MKVTFIASLVTMLHLVNRLMAIRAKKYQVVRITIAALMNRHNVMKLCYGAAAKPAYLTTALRSS